MCVFWRGRVKTRSQISIRPCVQLTNKVILGEGNAKLILDQVQGQLDPTLHFYNPCTSPSLDPFHLYIIEFKECVTTVNVSNNTGKKKCFSCNEAG